MAIRGIGATQGVEAALGASYRRYAADAPRDTPASSPGAPRDTLSPPPRAVHGAPPATPAALLGALIDRMGGTLASRAKGSYVNLRV